MKLQRKLTNREWEKVVALGAGVHMFRGKKTLIYNGEELVDPLGRWWHIPLYTREERQEWKVIIVLPGVEIIPQATFIGCRNVKTIIMSDSVKRIELGAFSYCKRLVFVRLSRNLEYIGYAAFCDCKSLTSIFVPPSCREIDDLAFSGCKKLIILSVPTETSLGKRVMQYTALEKACPVQVVEANDLAVINDNLNAWIKNLNENTFPLHRECASFDPSEDAIYELFKRQGIPSFLHVENDIGVTASQYLRKNPFSEIKEQSLINRYVLDLMGEIIT